MDSYEASTEQSENDKLKEERAENFSSTMERITTWKNSVDFSYVTVYFTLTAHEVQNGFKSRLQMAWVYICLFYGVLILMSTREVSALAGLFGFFINIGSIIAFSTAASSISGEIGGVADTLLCKSVRRWQYVLAKHTAHVIISLGIFLALVGLEILILYGMKALSDDMEALQMVIIISLNALVMVFFITLGIMLSSFFSKPLFAILGCFLAWFLLIFLFVIAPLDFPYSPVVFNGYFMEILEDTWEQPYWHLYLFYGCGTAIFVFLSIISLYTKDF